jgi:K+-sensing histidine kinase KdpD
LPRALRVRDDLLAALGHDLRNPLAPISMVLDALSRPGVDLAANAELLGMARRQMALVLRLLDEVAELNAVLRGNAPLSRERLELALIVGDAVSMFRASGTSTIEFEAGDEIAYVHVDPVRVTRALMRLIVFAHTDHDGSQPVTVSGTVIDGSGVVRIEYRRIAGDATVCDGLVDPFTSEQPVPPAQLLPVLGLWAVAQLFDRHGGSLRMSTDADRALHCLIASLPLVD